MDKKLILHIGTPKTATTSIQKFIQENDITLREKSFFPIFGDKLNNETLYRDFMSGELERVRSFLSEKINYPGTYILSCELFYTMPGSYDLLFSYQTHEEYSYEDKKIEYVKKLSELLFEYFDTVDVVVLYRNPIEFLNSSYIQDVQFNYNKSIECYKNYYNLELDYQKNLDIWKRFFPKVVYFVFEELVEEGSVEKVFFEYINIPFDINIPSINENYTLDTEIFLFKKRFNEVFYTSSHRFENIESVFYGHIDRILKDKIKDKNFNKHREITHELSKLVFKENYLSNLNVFGEEIVNKWSLSLNKKPSSIVDVDDSKYFFRFFYELELSLTYQNKDFHRMIKDSAEWNFSQDKMIDSLNDELKKLQSDNTVLELKIEDIKKDRANLVLEIEDIKKDRANLVLEIEDIKKDRANLVLEIEDINKNKANLNLEISTLQQQNLTLNHDISVLESHVGRIRFYLEHPIKGMLKFISKAIWK